MGVGGRLAEEEAGGNEAAVHRVGGQAETFQGDYAEEGLAVGRAKDANGSALLPVEADTDFGKVVLYLAAVSQLELAAPLRGDAQGGQGRGGHQGIDAAGVHHSGYFGEPGAGFGGQAEGLVEDAHRGVLALILYGVIIYLLEGGLRGRALRFLGYARNDMGVYGVLRMVAGLVRVGDGALRFLGCARNDMGEMVGNDRGKGAGDDGGNGAGDDGDI